MRAQQKNRPSASIVSYPARTTNDPLLRIVPTTTNAEEEIGTSAAASKKLKAARTLRKKPAQRNRPKPKQKAVEQRLSSQVGAHMTGPRHLSAASNAEQPVTLEEAFMVAKDEEMTSTANAVFAEPAGQLRIVVEDESIEPATLAGNKMSARCSEPEERSVTIASSESCESQGVMELFAGYSVEKPTFLRAISLQWTGLLRSLTRVWNWTQHKLKSHQVKKRLRVCETVSLGEKRFVAVIQVDGEQFLVGGSSSSVSTLAHLEPRRTFADVLSNRCEQDLSQA